MSLDISVSPYDIFRDWFHAARESEPNDFNAMALATATAEGAPSVRIVLLKEWDQNGFTFYTNLESRKGRELRENPHAALCFYWKSLQKQVRIEGRVHPVAEDQADVYFASRPRGSQLGAWASKQSERLESRAVLEQRFKDYQEKFAQDKTIARPPFWSGFMLEPVHFEFWINRENRLHDRARFSLEQGDWQGQRLYP